MFNLSTNNRIDYWQSGYKHLFDDWLPIMSYYLDSPIINALAYDAILYSKGFLLDMEKDFRQKLLNNKDLADYYQSLSQSLAIRDLFLSLPEDERQDKLDQINKEIETKEQVITEMIQRKGISMSMNITSRDIQVNLTEDDVAIEFVSFNIHPDSVVYCALVINSYSQAPKMIKLFDEEELIDVIDNNKDFASYIPLLVWEPLIKEIYGHKNVFFSPSKILNLIGIEYFLPDEIKDCDIYRLSSTKELCRKRAHNQWSNTALFGGLNYNNKTADFLTIYNSSGNQDKRGSFDILSHTMDEVLSIQKQLVQNKIHTIVFTGDSGTENNFYKLPQDDINLIHIASHGMFIENEVATEKSKSMNMPFLDFNIDDKTSYEDNSLNRAFLIMSGGNRRITRDFSPDDSEDGILTALEISRQNFKNLDLVVLSSCNSGIGELDSEGVWGLQRGFKIAGANAILMSLDNVDDKATQILMVEFYKNLMNGKSKLQSLLDAQKYLRQVEDGKYDNPKYWASFILLDGLD